MDMIEKICEVIDGEYVCDIDISVEEWKILGNGPNLLIVFYVQIMPDDFIMQLHRF